MIQRRKSGFTLIEMAVVLVIMGIIGSLFFKFLYDYLAMEKVDEAERVAAAASHQVTGFVLSESGELPTPQTGATLEDSFLPDALGVFQDPWGRSYRFWVATDSGGDPIDINDETETDLDVKIFTDPGTVAVDAVNNPFGGVLYQQIDDVAYVLLSDGANQSPQVDVTQSSLHVNVLRPGTALSSDPGTNFDDIITYKTLAELKTEYQTAGVTASDYDPPSGYKLNLDFSTGSYDPADLNGGATVSTIATATGGTMQVLELNQYDGNKDWLDLSDRTSGYTFSEFTIMGWFKTNTTTQNADFDVITSRQDSSQSDPWNYRNWWVVLWSTDYLTQGRGKEAGELSMKARSTNNQDFNIDTDCEQRACGGAHHDGNWHFFATRMKKISDTEYRADAYVSEGAAGARTIVSSTSDSQSLFADASAEPFGGELNNFDRNAPPKTGATYTLYVGRGTASGRYFDGSISEVIFYDTPLEDSVIKDYFDRVKVLYP